MTHLFYVPLGEDETFVRCDECSSIIALSTWWEHARWHEGLREVVRVLVAEAVLNIPAATARSLFRGMDQAARGELTSLGSFSQYDDDE